MTENYFNSIKKYLKECSSEDEHRVIQNMDNLYSHIFLLCKKEKFEEAQSELNLADHHFNVLVKSTKIEDHVNILKLPIVAYLLFKLDDFDKAEALLLESVAASYNLEKIKESFFLKMFRTQQYHNDARIYFKKEAYDTWILKMKERLNELLSYTKPLTDEETSVYVTMVDQFVYEVIRFGEFLKEEKYLEQLLQDLNFKHSLFATHDTLRSIRNWCLVKSKIYKYGINFIDAYQQIENILYDNSLKNLYKKSLLMSVAPYVSDVVFLSYLDILKGKKLIC